MENGLLNVIFLKIILNGKYELIEWNRKWKGKESCKEKIYISFGEWRKIEWKWYGKWDERNSQKY